MAGLWFAAAAVASVLGWFGFDSCLAFVGVVLDLRVFVVIVVVASVWFRLIAILCMVGYCGYLC